MRSMRTRMYSRRGPKPGIGRIGRGSAAAGFTLIELIVVIAIIGILAALALPNLKNGPRRANEAVLKTNLHTLRQVIDMHAGDKGYYPPSLDGLVDEGYLRNVPLDPVFGEAEWGIEYEEPETEDFEPAETDLAEGGGEVGIVDVYSLSEDVSLDGMPYSEW